MICTIRLMIAGRFLEVKMMDLDQRVMVISGRVLIGSPIRACHDLQGNGPDLPGRQLPPGL